MVLMISGSVIGSPKKSTADIPLVKEFELNRYLGKWYEIARLPHRFEKGLTHVTADYSLRKDGKIRVLNQGLKNGDPKKRKTAEGKAYVPDSANPARLKVSFFLFFYGDYRIILLDEKDYQYAVVTSKTRDYLWILARQPVLEEELYQKLTGFVREKGFDMSKLIKVNHK
jgi:lipocalin